MTKILVIEDDTIIRESIIEILQDGNIDAIGAENGEQGLQLAREYQPDLIICDITMPDMDGYSVLTELRQDPTTVIIPFIFLTAKADRDDFRLGMELGADDYITKPCTPTELLSAIATQLKKQAAYMQQYVAERDKAKGLQQRIKELQRLSNSSEDLLQRISQELRDPLSNITMAIQMLKIAPSEAAREHYLQILHQECAREISLINQLSNLKEFLSPESASLLQQFNIFNKPKD
jgi:DNA-binding response OmpR family regulator